MRFFSHCVIFLLFTALLCVPCPKLNAQEKDWFDSLQVKRQKKERLPRIDTNRWYEPNVTLSMFNHFRDNPGYCGVEQKYKYQTAYKYDKPFFDTEPAAFHPRSLFASFEFSAGKKRSSGVGFCFSNTRAGPNSMSEVNFAYAYKFHFGKYNDLRVGMSMEYFENSNDFASMTFPDQISPEYGFVFNTSELLPFTGPKRNINFNTGISYRYKRFYSGFSVLNITKPDISFISLERLKRQFTLSAGHTFIICSKVEISSSALARIIGKEFTADFHLTGVFWKHFIAGVSLNELTTASVDLGYSLWNILTFYASAGISTNSELYYHFGPLHYVSANLRIQLGKYQKAQ